MKKILLILLLTLNFKLHSQVGKNYVLMVNALAEPDGITLSWKAQSFSGSYIIYKRDQLSNYNWGNAIATLPSTATSYKDLTATPGKSYDYRIIKTDGTNILSGGFIYAGNELKEVPYKGGVVLMIDSTYINSLQFEISRLETDLTNEGWNVNKLYIGRKEIVTDVKNKLRNHISNWNKPTTTILIIGHVPVPYSGGFTGDGSNWPPPDGHVEGVGNHTGAWPCDAYYGELDGEWTDSDIIMLTGNDSRNHNNQYDGKFDQTKLPSKIELEVGRVDLFNMPAFGLSDIELTKRYLNRNHLWRTGQIQCIERGLIDDNFTGLSLSATGYNNFSAFFPIDSVYNNKDYFTELRNQNYLWSFGCGAGSYTSCSGIGVTNDFKNDSLKNIFTIMSGSFFGDWDVSNNILRAPLCKNALVNFWGGIPKWYIHTMAMGKHIGYGTKESQNNTTFYLNGGFNASDNKIHIALMGDPTLCNRHLPPVKGLTSNSQSKIVKLKWNKSNGIFDGYAIYKLDTSNNTYYRVNNKIVTDTFYNDSMNFHSGNYLYVVKTIKKEITASGSYYNVGAGSMASVAHINSLSSLTQSQLKVYPNPTQNVINIEGKYLNINLYDMQGREISIIVNNNQIDLKALDNGIYILKVVNQFNQEITTPIIKQ